MNKNMEVFDIPECLEVPSAYIAKERNLKAMSTKALWFQAGLIMMANIVQILMIIFFPLKIMNSTLWIAALVITLISFLLIKTIAGYISTGISTGFLISYTFLELANRTWLIVFTFLSIIYLALVLLKYNKSLRHASIDNKYTACKILLMRPFHNDYAMWIRNLLIPVLNNYGKVTHISDKSFENTPFRGIFSYEIQKTYTEVIKRKDLSKEEKNMFHLVDKFTNGDPLFGQKFSDADWKQNVKELLKKTDIAIIDISKLGQGLLWEIQTTFEIIPVERIIIIANIHKNLQVELIKLLNNFKLSGLSTQPLFVIGYNPQQPFAFIGELHTRILQIIRKSLPTLLEKLDCSIKSKNQKSIVLALEALGDAYFGLEGLSLAQIYYEEALDLAEKNKLETVFLIIKLDKIAKAKGDKTMENRYLAKLLSKD